MHKFRVLLEVRKKTLSESEAATMLETSDRAVRQMVTIWGAKLRYIAPIIDKLIEPVNSKADQTKLKKKLAELMGVTVRAVNMQLAREKIEIPTPTTRIVLSAKHIKAAARIKRNKKLTLDVVAGLNTAEYAAEAAEVTKRQIYRMAGDLVALEGYTFKDLKYMDSHTRSQLANRLEELVIGKDQKALETV